MNRSVQRTLDPLPPAQQDWPPRISTSLVSQAARREASGRVARREDEGFGLAFASGLDHVAFLSPWWASSRLSITTGDDCASKSDADHFTGNACSICQAHA